MEARPAAAPLPEGRRSWLGPALVAGLCGVAYRPLWLGWTSVHLDQLIFRPGPVPVPLVLAVAGFLLWRRRERLAALPERPAPLLAIALAAIGTALFVWSHLTGKTDLLMISLAGNGLALAAATRGRAGCRACLMPACVLLLGVAIPLPLEDELVWRLQVGSAHGAGWLLDLLGRDFRQSGVMLRNGSHSFHVIDGCSGMTGIAILLLVAFVVRDLFADAGWRSWLVVALAPILGFALNVVRVTYVAASPNPEALAGLRGNHTPQGIAVLMAGTAILYALGWAMPPAVRGDAPDRTGAPPSAPRRRTWTVAAVGLAVLAALPLALPRFSTPRPAWILHRPEWPATKAGWTSEPTAPDPLFVGSLPGGLQARYELEESESPVPEIVDVLIAYDVPAIPASSRVVSSKLELPGPDWDLVRTRSDRVWTLDQDAELSLASWGEKPEHAVVYTWRLRDRGVSRESLRSFLALESSPFRRDRPRGIVQLVAYAPHDGQLVLDWAKQRLDRFATAFREELEAL